MIGKVIYNLLSNASAVTDIVGTKIYPEIAPEGTDAPAIIYDVQNIEPVYSGSGFVHDMSSVDIDCFHPDYTDSVDLMVAIRTAVELKSGTYNNVTIKKSRVRSIISGWDPIPDAYWWRITVDFENS
jgi:hypothetical protein